jgi:hypothetical protein
MQRDNKNKGGFLALFIVGFILCIIGGVAWLRKEDNGFSRLASGVANQNVMIKNIEDKYSKLLEDYVAQQASNKVISETQNALLNKMQMLEMRMDAQPKHQAPVVMPNKVSLQVDKPLELKWPAQAVQVIYREGPPVKFKTKKPTPLLDKAGVTKRRAAEVNQ